MLAIARRLRITLLLLAVGAVSAPDSTAAPFAAGDFITYDQDAWGDVPAPGTASALLDDLAYWGGVVQIGVSSTDHLMVFTSVAAVVNYLPASGPPGPLSSYLVDPTSTPSGLLGGEVLALQFNVDLTDGGSFGGAAGIPFGDLMLAGLVFTPEFNGMTIRELLGEANRTLGGAGTTSYDELFFLLRDVNGAFVAGVPTDFAQDHLIAPGRSVPEPGTAGLLVLSVAGAIARRRRTGGGRGPYSESLIAWCRSRRAFSQSRRTVRSDTPRIAASSPNVKPQKNFRSTSCASAGSSASSSFTARSSWS